MINPYYIYIITFLVSLVVYQFGWSTLFPTLKIPLIIFLTISMVMAFILGLIFHAKNYISFRKLEWDFKIPLVVIFITIIWATEFIYNGGIPLIMILKGEPYDYITFGIPTLHVFAVTFTSFFAVYLFHVYISTKRKSALIYYIITMSFALLLFNRGMFMINVISSIFVYLQQVRRLSIRRLTFLTCFLIVILYLFGVLGHLRTSHIAGTKYSGEHILNLVKADQGFINSKIPSEFIWSYLYISSPLANLQYNIDQHFTLERNNRNMILFLNNEFLFDFISKRTNIILNAQRVSCIRFTNSMTVGSVYANSYIYFGWIGLAMMTIYILCVPVFYLGLIRKRNTFYVTATSILGSVYLFLIFDNMFTFTGLSFQLVYPLFMGIFFRQPPNDHNEIINSDVNS
jgi:hypothetical protein